MLYYFLTTTGDLVPYGELDKVFKAGTAVVVTSTIHLSYFGKTAFFQVVPVKMQVIEKLTEVEEEIDEII
jgi:hypothetical protein